MGKTPRRVIEIPDDEDEKDLHVEIKEYVWFGKVIDWDDYDEESFP